MTRDTWSNTLKLEQTALCLLLNQYGNTDRRVAGGATSTEYRVVQAECIHTGDLKNKPHEYYLLCVCSSH